MSTSKQKIENAEEVIQRFGGIRPMAKKINAAVTTVQGWKKRGTIPASRTEEIVRAAKENNISISDFLGGESANENIEPSKLVAPVKSEKRSAGKVSATKKEVSNVKEFKTSPSTESVEKGKSSGTGSGGQSAHKDILSKLRNEEQVNKQQSLWIAILLVVVTIVAGVILLSPAADKQAQRLQQTQQKVGALEADVNNLKQGQDLFAAIVPENWENQMGALREQAERTREDIRGATQQLETVSNELLSGNSGALNQRLQKLEGHVQELIGSPALANMMDKITRMQGAAGGQRNLDGAVSELNGILARLNGNTANMENAFDAARLRSPALGQTFERVPKQELKAAATLFGMNQMRAALNRDNEAFADDLALVKQLVANDNPEFAAQLDRLAPQAQNGVLTVNGLSQEFRGLAGEVVVASLKGEDVSVQERAQARLNELFSIEKNGELITGTDTQSKIARTQNYLDAGQIEQAIVEMKTFQGPEAQLIAPFLGKAQATVDASRVKDVIENTIILNAYGRGSAAPAGSLIQDKARGINLYKTDF